VATTIQRLGKPVRRRVHAGGDRDLVVEIGTHGITLRGHGTSRSLFVNYQDVAKAASLPGEMPAKFVAAKIQWLISR